MHIDHAYPLAESMAPKGALCLQHARFPVAHPNGHQETADYSNRNKKEQIWSGLESWGVREKFTAAGAAHAS